MKQNHWNTVIPLYKPLAIPYTYKINQSPQPNTSKQLKSFYSVLQAKSSESCSHAVSRATLNKVCTQSEVLQFHPIFTTTTGDSQMSTVPSIHSCHQPHVKVYACCHHTILGDLVKFVYNSWGNVTMCACSFTDGFVWPTLNLPEGEVDNIVQKLKDKYGSDVLGLSLDLPYIDGQ